MSLFKLKHLWLQSFPDEQFDERHLSIGRIDESPAIALGSFSGILRLFVIHCASKFQVNLVYETNLQSPIISVEFLDRPQQRSSNTVGILTFRKFTYIKLKKNYEKNNYETKSSSLVVDPAFAIEKNTLSLFTLNSTVQYLNPISSQNIKVSDPIYPFARLNSSIYYADGEELVMVQNTSQQWRLVVGPMRSLHLFQDIIIAIGDNALWEVKDSHILKTKSIQQDVSCGTIIPKGKDYNVIIANFSNQIFIYTSNYSLIWAMKANEIPIKILIFEHNKLFGALALLGQEGTISISYVGTQLPQTSIQPLQQNINMQQVQAQTNRMLGELRSKESKELQNHYQQKQINSDVKLIVKAKQPRKTQQIVENDLQFYRKNGQLWLSEIQCQIITQKQGLSDIVISITSLPSNITCLNNSRKITRIQSRQKCMFSLLCSQQLFPFDFKIQVAMRYEYADKRNRVSLITQTCDLPLNFQCQFRSNELEEKPSNKIVLKASSNLPSVQEIFHQFSSQITNAKNISVFLANGVVCSLGYNKDNTKVKIESNFFSGLCFMLKTFISRFEKTRKQGKNQLSIDETPLQQLFALMKDHFNLRQSIKQCKLQLEKLSQQFRNTQKKMILKMKEKNSSINSLDKLLEYSYQNLITAANLYESTILQIEKVNHNFEISIHTVLQMLFLKSKSNEKCRMKVKGIIGYEKQSLDYGWEQKLMANSSFYLGKKFNYMIDTYGFDQLYKTSLWVISKINSGQWNQ